MGKMADDLLLASARVMPSKLAQAGFEFHRPEIASALTASLG
jgi:NAD dependent epimerase/dehydratase family enzyme